MKKMEIRPIDRIRWHKKTGKESFTRPRKIQPLVNSETMTYDTGLTKQEIEKFSKIFKQDLSPVYNPEQPHQFWDSPIISVKLENNTMFLNLEKDIDYIKGAVIKQSRFVANSLREYEEGLFPDATHYIVDEVEEVERIASKIETKKQATIKASKISGERKREIIIILSGKNVKGNSDAFVEVELDKLINGKDSKPAEVLRLIEEDPKKTKYLAVVLEALQKNVLKRAKHKIMYFESTLGTSAEDVADFLMEDENQDLYLQILKTIN